MCGRIHQVLLCAEGFEQIIFIWFCVSEPVPRRREALTRLSRAGALRGYARMIDWVLTNIC